MTVLQRLDEQLASIMDQRRKLQEELRTIQQQINEEFDRMTRLPADLALRPPTPPPSRAENGRPAEPRPGLLGEVPPGEGTDEGPVIPRIEGMAAFRQ
jgi:hypothetical protein